MSSNKPNQPTLPNVAEAELSILKMLWELGPVTARDIRSALYPSNSASDRATVQKLLERLESKQLVHRDRSRFVHEFTATVSRDEFVGWQVEALATRLTDGSFMPLITHLIGEERLSSEDGE